MRKLEFLLAQAVEEGCDSVVTVGGVQSNHCRAVAVAARRLGMEPWLVLRSARPGDDPGFAGNLLFSRLAGAQLRLASREQYRQHGSLGLVNLLAAELRAARRRPYVIPVGGSNALGTWGYLEAAAELLQQAPAVLAAAAGDAEGGGAAAPPAAAVFSE